MKHNMFAMTNFTIKPSFVLLMESNMKFHRMVQINLLFCTQTFFLFFSSSCIEILGILLSRKTFFPGKAYFRIIINNQHFSTSPNINLQWKYAVKFNTEL